MQLQVVGWSGRSLAGRRSGVFGVHMASSEPWKCWAVSIGGVSELGGSVWRGHGLDQGLKSNLGGLAQPRDRIISALVDRGHPETAAKLSQAPPCHFSLGSALQTQTLRYISSSPCPQTLFAWQWAVALTQLTVSFAKQKIPQVSGVGAGQPFQRPPTRTSPTLFCRFAQESPQTIDPLHQLPHNATMSFFKKLADKFDDLDLGGKKVEQQQQQPPQGWSSHTPSSVVARSFFRESAACSLRLTQAHRNAMFYATPFGPRFGTSFPDSKILLLT